MSGPSRWRWALGVAASLCLTGGAASAQDLARVGSELATLESQAQRLDEGLRASARPQGPAVEERFARAPRVDVEAVKRNILGTRFPVPGAEERRELEGYPRLVRAADLIGQLSDPRYLRKIPALFYEFEETGVNRLLGYTNPGDLRRNYPRFYWTSVYPHVKDMLELLCLTQGGLQARANLYANVFMVEHELGFLPEPEARSDP